MKNHAFQQLTWSALDAQALLHLIELARAEDLEGAGLLEAFPYAMDVTCAAMLDTGTTGRARLVARQPMVLCGTRLIPLVLAAYGGDCDYMPRCDDGQVLDAGAIIGELSGDVMQMLQAERVLLNFVQKLSGIATLTSTYVKALDGTATRVLDTRKTTPGYRVLEKYATACGGGWNHRRGLYEWILVKDNHLSGSGAQEGARLAERVRRAKRRFPDLIVEVEVDRMDQIEPVMEAGADIIMLDNFETHSLRKAVTQVNGRAITEASGGITLSRLPEIGQTGVDFVSCGATVHQSQWVDIGLDWGKSPEQPT